MQFAKLGTRSSNEHRTTKPCTYVYLQAYISAKLNHRDARILSNIDWEILIPERVSPGGRYRAGQSIVFPTTLPWSVRGIERSHRVSGVASFIPAETPHRIDLPENSMGARLEARPFKETVNGRRGWIQTGVKIRNDRFRL